jgi:hypothetical protein
MIKPGEIYLADLYEAGVRPILVVSRESLNRGGYDARSFFIAAGEYLPGTGIVSVRMRSG